MSQTSPAGVARPELPGYISRGALERTAESREAFRCGEPFRHVRIDAFFEDGFAEQLLADFPVFDPALAKNEIYGGVWGKAGNANIRGIAPVYRELYDLIESRTFLDWMSELTGIPELLFDSGMYGGGTHENLHGQDLDPHVDFNYDEAQKLHRRLNLIVYLNKGWQAEWGGALELHSNPRRPQENRYQSFNPIFNRAVLFETNERSWHGFPRIDLPPAERNRSRKSISIYLYTRERPAEEIAPLHGTFYVQRPLPAWVQPGHALTEDECRYLNHAVDRRDKWIESYQKMELAKSGQVAQHASYIRELVSRVHAPFTGYVMQEGGSEGLYGDGWAKSMVRLQIRPQQEVTALRLRGWRPEYAPAEATVSVRVNGQTAAETTVGQGAFEVEIRGPLFPQAETAWIEIGCAPAFRPAGDDRELAFVLMEIRAEHGK